MAQLTSEFWAAVGPFTTKYFGLARQKVKTQYSQIFNVGTLSEGTFEFREYGGAGILPIKDEGAAVVQDFIYQGTGKRFIPQTYASKMSLSFEAIDDVKYDEIKRSAASMGMGVEMTPEYNTALYLDRAFNSSYKVCSDNLELCSTAHLLPKGGTYPNELTTAAVLSETSIEQMMIDLRGQLGTDSLKKPRTIKALVVPSALWPTAEKLSITKKQVGTANNTESIVTGTKIIVFDFLGSNSRWFALTDMNDEDNGLFWKWRRKPEFVEENAYSNLSRSYVAFFRAVYGIINPRAIYGSAAA